MVLKNKKSIQIEKQIKDFESLFSNLNNTALFKTAISLLAAAYAIIKKLNVEIQTKNDIINQLKGEQGKPDILPNKKVDGNFSSSSELKTAETNIGNKKFGFKLSEKKLEQLKETDIPKIILEKLDVLKKTNFDNEIDFNNAITKVIGKTNFEKHNDKLKKHARYRKRNRKEKVSEIEIDRVEICKIDRKKLPDDAVSNGYSDKVVQDIEIRSDNIKFRQESFYSRSEKKTYTADVPDGYEGGYGPGIKSQIFSMKYQNNMSEPKILEALNSVRVLISGTYISQFLTQGNAINIFHKEKNAIYETGLKIVKYIQIDDTGSRENGINKYVQILCHPLFTLFFTTDKKDRLTIIDLFRFFEARTYLFNEEAFELLRKMHVYENVIKRLKSETASNKIFDETEIKQLLEKIFPSKNQGKNNKTRIMEAGLIAAYHNETDIPIIKTIIADDAPQFKLITENLSLCWVHEGRHYKKLQPILEEHKKALNDFSENFWLLYKNLFDYKKEPNVKLKLELEQKFDEVFSSKYDYEELQNRINKSKKKKKELLIVLNQPEIPLHNNQSENGARIQKRREDVSLQTKSKAGTKAKDTMQSIVETCKKVNVNVYDYIYDRISNSKKILPFSEIIKSKMKILRE